MDPTRDSLQDKWSGLKGQARQKWSRLIDDDIAALSGKALDLANLLQQRYRYGRVEADMEVRNWLRHQP
jgi:uncharacterized protein YjbJ (UPF0337 family)